MLFAFFLKMKGKYLSEFKMQTTEHKKHWTSFSEIWPTVGFSSGWKSLMRKVLCSEIFCLLVMTEAVAQRCSVKMVFLDTSQNSYENTCAKVSLSRGWSLQLFKKETLAQLFSWKFCEIAKNKFLSKHL